MATNLYEILGITKEVTQEEVRKAYLRRALQTHPDRLAQNVSAADKQAAQDQFRLVNNAYEVLYNPKNRKLYDIYGVWPPPTDQPDLERSSRRGAFGHDPFANHPFFNSEFRRPRQPFGFTDPFELFNSLFGDLHSTFDNDPFFANTPFVRSPFDDPFFRTPFGPLPPFGRGDPFGRSMFGSPPFASMHGGGSMFPAIQDMPGANMYSSSTESVGQNGRFVSRSQTTRTVNGRTEVINKQIDAAGNEHITYKSPEGERYTINGVEQPSRGSVAAPRHSGTGRSSRQPPAPIADMPANPPAKFAPPQPAQAQSYNVPIAGPSRSHTQRHSYAPPQMQTEQPERRSSRHSHQEQRVSHDDLRRAYTIPIPAASPLSAVPERERRLTADHAHVTTPIIPEGYDTVAHRDVTPPRHYEKERDRNRERRGRKSRSYRDSRDGRDNRGSKRMDVNGDKSRENDKEKEQRGWRGW